MENKRFVLLPGVLIVLAMAGVLLTGGVLAGAAGTGEPGSKDDPLVTRSFVLEQIETALKGRVDTAVKSHMEKNTSWQVAELNPGQQFEGKAGAEFIVRAGKAVVVDPPGSGIPDVTSGTNIRGGSVLALDHQLIIPRTDGRGFICGGTKKVIVMFKGEAVIK